MRNALRLLPLVFAAAAFAPAAACSEKKESLRTRLMVTGESESKAAPDTAVIVLSVVTQSKGALDAQQQNARKSDAVIQAVKQAAGANPDIKTSGYSLEPQQDYEGAVPHIRGYEASNTVTVSTTALDNVGAIIDAATQAGANSVEGVRFILREGDKAHGQALADASKQAMAKARAMAQSLGGRITRVVEEREGNFPEQLALNEQTVGYASSNANLDIRARRTPVEAGTLDVRSQVYLIVEVETNP
jgi:uncharacterized protein YggE